MATPRRAGGRQIFRASARETACRSRKTSVQASALSLRREPRPVPKRKPASDGREARQPPQAFMPGLGGLACLLAIRTAERGPRKITTMPRGAGGELSAGVRLRLTATSFGRRPCRDRVPSLTACLFGPSSSQGRWRFGRYSTRPVLKHGPRSLTCVRVGGCLET